MPSTSNYADDALLAREFSTTCSTLSRIALLPAERRAGLEEAFARFEDAALALSRTDAARRNRDTWAHMVPRAMSMRLIRAFAADTTIDCKADCEDETWTSIAWRASPAYLEELEKLGVDLRRLHPTLMKRALSQNGAEIHSFLETRIASVFWAEDFISATSNRSLAFHAGFLARYLEMACQHHLRLFEDWNLRATRAMRGRDMLIYAALGLKIPEDEFVAEHLRTAFDAHSGHRRMQLEDWKRDLEALLRNEGALTWAADHLVPTSN